MLRPFDSGHRLHLLAGLTALTLSGCASGGAGQANLDATLWVQTSAEYEAVARSVYATATRLLEEAMADSALTAALEQTGAYRDLPPAVIVDVDETVLDNSPFQARLLIAGELYDRESWARWVREAAAEPVPGSLVFAQTASDLGVTVFYVTNRDVELEAPTRRNLERLGFPLASDLDPLLTRGEQPEWTSDKTSRRHAVSRTHRVLMLIGDDLNDFMAVGRRTPEERAALAAAHADRWGGTWHMLPGPTYGSWERALYGFEYDLGGKQRVDRKRDHLESGT